MSRPALDLIIIEQLDPDLPRPGGIETIIGDIARFAVDLRIGIIGVTTKAEHVGKWRLIEFRGRSIWFFAAARFSSSPHGPLSRLPDSLRLAIGLALHRPRWRGGLVHVHRIEFGALLSLRHARDYVQFLHNDSAGLLGPSSDSFWRRLAPFYRLLERLSLRSAAGVGVFNATDAPRLRRIRADVVTLRTWFDPTVFYPPRAPRVRDTTIEVLWAGRLESQKDPFLALDIAAASERHGSYVQLTIIGAGSMREGLLRSIENRKLRVRLVGPVPKQDVADRMRAADVLLLTSHYEGSPNVIAEAMACGLPVVATAESDPDRAIESGSTGITDTARNADALARALVAASQFERGAVAAAAADRSADRLIPVMLRVGRLREEGAD